MEARCWVLLAGATAADMHQHHKQARLLCKRAQPSELFLHLDCEVDVAGRVDDVDLLVLPGAVGGGRLDGDALLALQLHVVHLGAHTVLAAHLRREGAWQPAQVLLRMPEQLTRGPAAGKVAAAVRDGAGGASAPRRRCLLRLLHAGKQASLPTAARCNWGPPGGAGAPHGCP